MSPFEHRKPKNPLPGFESMWPSPAPLIWLGGVVRTTRRRIISYKKAKRRPIFAPPRSKNRPYDELVFAGRSRVGGGDVVVPPGLRSRFSWFLARNCYL